MMMNLEDLEVQVETWFHFSAFIPPKRASRKGPRELSVTDRCFPSIEGLQGSSLKPLAPREWFLNLPRLVAAQSLFELMNVSSFSGSSE